MSISDFVGPINTEGAALLSVACISACVIVTTVVAKFRSGHDTDQQFELEKLRIANADAADARKVAANHEQELGKIAMRRDVEIHQVERGLVTSHARAPEKEKEKPINYDC